MTPENSRRDLSVEDIEDRIRKVKRDQRFPKDHKPTELRYLYALLKYRRGEWVSG